MGYYATFDCDIHIHASKVGAARKAILAHEKFGPELEQHGNFADAIGEWFYESESWIEEPAPLVQLADAVNETPAYGDYYLQGPTHQKWTRQEELLDIIAPFVTPGGTIHVRGEENEETKYKFDGEKRIEEWSRTLWPEEYEPLESAEKALREIAALLSPGCPMPLVQQLRNIVAEHRADLLGEE